MASPKKMVRATSSNLLADDAFGMTTAENLSVSHSHDSDVAATTQPARLFSHEFMDHQTATAPSATTYNLLVAGLVSFSVAGGYLAGTQPNGEWRFFSWHPLLMTIGMVGLMGIGAITKKLGGYTNTKVNRKTPVFSCVSIDATGSRHPALALRLPSTFVSFAHFTTDSCTE
jgi:hypothetical protein